MHPLAVPVRRAVFVAHLETFETEVHSCFAKSQRYKWPDHGAPDNEPGFVPFPWILIRLPEFRDRTNHLSGDNVKLYADSPGLISLLVMVEPQAAFEGAYGQTNTSYSARSATGKK
jgi:hypothetical protein